MKEVIDSETGYVLRGELKPAVQVEDRRIESVEGQVTMNVTGEPTVSTENDVSSKTVIPDGKLNADTDRFGTGCTCKTKAETSGELYNELNVVAQDKACLLEECIRQPTVIDLVELSTSKTNTIAYWMLPNGTTQIVLSNVREVHPRCAAERMVNWTILPVTKHIVSMSAFMKSLPWIGQRNRPARKTTTGLIQALWRMNDKDAWASRFQQRVREVHN